MKPIYFFLSIITSFGSLQGQICYQFDSNFGTNGLGTDQFYDFQFELNIKKMLVQSNQRIILVGNRYNNFKSEICIKGYTSNGHTDLSFGINGKICLEFENYFYPTSATLQNDQKIIVTGTIESDGKYQLGILRFTSNGFIDTEFGKAGLVKTSFSWIYDIPVATTLQPDGKILIAGNSWDEDGASRFMVARYLPNGTIDSTFGSNGKSFSHLGPKLDSIGHQVYGKYAHDLVNRVFIQLDGKILVVGLSYFSCSDFEYYGGLVCDNVLGMLRYFPSGSLDSSFGNAGKVLEDLFFNINSAALQDDGKILVTGSGDRGTFITARFNPDGKLDKTFGTNGLVLFTHLNYPYTWPSDILIDKDGKIIVMGNTSSNPGSHSVVIQYDLDGKPINQPAITNSISLHFGAINENNFVLAAALQENNILVAGYIANPNSSEQLLYRLSGKLAKPEIKFNGFQLYTQYGYSHYQWYLNDKAITGSDTSSFRPSQTGAYQVVVTNNEGCSNTSDYFPHLILASKDISLGKIKLRYYPNPVQNGLYVDLLESNGQKLQAELYDLSGKIVHHHMLNQLSNQIPIQHLAAGVYQLRLKYRNESISTKIMVVK